MFYIFQNLSCSSDPTTNFKSRNILTNKIVSDKKHINKSNKKPTKKIWKISLNNSGFVVFRIGC